MVIVSTPKPIPVASEKVISEVNTFPMAKSKSDMLPAKHSTPDVIESPARKSKMLDAPDQPSLPLDRPLNTGNQKCYKGYIHYYDSLSICMYVYSIEL